MPSLSAACLVRWSSSPWPSLLCVRLSCLRTTASSSRWARPRTRPNAWIVSMKTRLVCTMPRAQVCCVAARLCSSSVLPRCVSCARRNQTASSCGSTLVVARAGTLSRWTSSSPSLSSIRFTSLTYVNRCSRWLVSASNASVTRMCRPCAKMPKTLRCLAFPTSARWICLRARTPFR